MNLEVRFVPLESRLQGLQFEHKFDLIRISDEEYTDPRRLEKKLSDQNRWCTPALWENAACYVKNAGVAPLSRWSSF